MTDSYTMKQKKKYFEELGDVVGPLPHDVEGLHAIVELALTKAADKAVAAGFNGSYDDGGGRAMVNATIKFVAGVIFARTGVIVDAEYNEMLQKYHLEHDFEYDEYQRLKKKFGDM